MDLTEIGVTISGDLYVRGDIVNADLIQLGLDNQKLLMEVDLIYTKLKVVEAHLNLITEQLKNLNIKMNAVWYAPNMPGFVMAEQSFNSSKEAPF